ncbi:MAG TPA: twin-arginine translocation signal domain-containing protein, partial [Blastocatellia bacterium]|nr:twin-arginine translocation signal domain-containing protein [Blastocatellia bacterium]
MSDTKSRRDFLKQASAAAATFSIASNRVLGANDRLNIGFIGCGG